MLYLHDNILHKYDIDLVLMLRRANKYIWYQMQIHPKEVEN